MRLKVIEEETQHPLIVYMCTHGCRYLHTHMCVIDTNNIIHTQPVSHIHTRAYKHIKIK